MMFLRNMVQGEGKLFALLTANVTLEGAHNLLEAVQPIFSAALIIVQLAVGIITLRHLIQKMLDKKRNKKTELPDEETES